MINEKLMTGCWHGQPCFVIGGGPSLRGFNFDLLNGQLTIGTNRVFEFFSPTILLAIDARFWEWVNNGSYGRETENKLAWYKGIKAGIKIHKPHMPGVIEIQSCGPNGPIIPIERGIYHGNNSGYSAVALALALGADPVYVMGIDLRYDGDVTHFHDGHPEKTPEKQLHDKCLQPFIDLSHTPEGMAIRLVNLQWPGENFSLLSGLFPSVNINFAVGQKCNHLE
jgi:hypothetical protein